MILVIENGLLKVLYFTLPYFLCIPVSAIFSMPRLLYNQHNLVEEKGRYLFVHEKFRILKGYWWKELQNLYRTRLGVAFPQSNHWIWSLLYVDMCAKVDGLFMCFIRVAVSTSSDFSFIIIKGQSTEGSWIFVIFNMIYIVPILTWSICKRTTSTG